MRPEPEPLEENNFMSTEFLENQFKYKNLMEIRFIGEPALRLAIKWLKAKLCMNKNFCSTKKITKYVWKCRNCKIIDEAFPDLKRGEGGKLKSARIAKIENLPQSKIDELGMKEGFAIIEIRNPNLREEIKPLREGGIREYLLSLGDFNDIDITETD